MIQSVLRDVFSLAAGRRVRCSCPPIQDTEMEFRKGEFEDSSADVRKMTDRWKCTNADCVCVAQHAMCNPEE